MIIYLDVDGLFADFAKSYFALFAEGEKRGLGKAIKRRIFEDLDWMPNGKRLYEYMQTHRHNHQIELLTSLGSPPPFHKQRDEVIRQKTHWFNKVGLDFKPNFATHKEVKKEWAHPHTILVDDTHSNVIQFREAGGHAFHYDDSKFDDFVLEFERFLNDYRHLK